MIPSKLTLEKFPSNLAIFLDTLVSVQPLSVAITSFLDKLSKEVRLDNLFGSDFSKIGYYNCKSLLDVGTVITINLNKNISNFTFILITFSDSGYNDIFHSYTIPVLLFKNYNLSFRFTIEPYMDLIYSNPAYNDFINFKYKSEQEITFEVYRKNNNTNNYDTNNYITIYGFKL